MKGTLAFIVTAVFVGGASAQAQSGASSEGQVIMNTKPQEHAQAKDKSRPQGDVKKVGGDELNSSTDDAIGTGKAAAAGQKKVNSRNARHPNRSTPQQGGTPDMVDGS